MLQAQCVERADQACAAAAIDESLIDTMMTINNTQLQVGRRDSITCGR
ncbi:hypothetical protein HC891_06165 [Candidatus Gracilibacteria bacterium]|nr:hypothetical protein [Candidatus Gracilibacteria bacterium]